MSSITTSKGGRSWGESRSDRPTPRRSTMATRAKEPGPVSSLRNRKLPIPVQYENEIRDAHEIDGSLPEYPIGDSNIVVGA